MECKALMVVLDNDVERFMSVDMDISDGIMPTNTTRDIMRIVSICNYSYSDENVKFIDMYGIITKDGTDIWEVEDNAIQK